MSQQHPNQPPYPQQPNQLPPAPQYPNHPMHQPPYAAQAYGHQPQVAPKNPGLALLASFFIPGLGSLINGRVALGIIIFVAYCIAWLLTLVLVGIILLPIIWAWGMIDAYQGAKKWNANHGIIS